MSLRDKDSQVVQSEIFAQGQGVDRDYTSTIDLNVTPPIKIGSDTSTVSAKMSHRKATEQVDPTRHYNRGQM
ncbi:hypothetical protein BGZ96_001359 [Linnemannia gamsii]|uniref:Uncharacterized protein n=1 Tax=Linnemannia gamsii TaxID=64522 RepID=A0ABQ7K979_9FUNG|nr:hypothetical protein BGZ96_001359 [Linnemannia gamsii]